MEFSWCDMAVKIGLRVSSLTFWWINSMKDGWIWFFREFLRNFRAELIECIVEYRKRDGFRKIDIS